MSVRPRDEEIVVPEMNDNETWNTCPTCLKDWKDKVATPGLIHRTRACDDCIKKVNG